MDNLLPPEVAAPISEENTQVTVVGVRPDAHVTVNADGHTVGHGDAAPAGEAIGLTQNGETYCVVGVTSPLRGGQRVTAKQTVAHEESASSAPVTVIPVPPALPALVPAAIPFVGTEVLLVRRLFPGGSALVDVDRGGTHLQAEVTVADWEQPLAMPKALEAGDTISILIRVGPRSNGWTTPEPVNWWGGTPEATLPTPYFELPPQACDRGVLLGGIVPGATVVVEIAGVPHRQTALVTHIQVPVDSYVFAGQHDKPLAEGDQIVAWQEFPSTGQHGGKLVGKAAPAQPPLAPVISEVLCPSSREMMVSGYRPGATIHIYQAPKGSTTFARVPELTHRAPLGNPDTVRLPHALKAGASIAATQEPCVGRESDRSAPTVVADSPWYGGKPTIDEPALQCAAGVTARYLTAGARASIWSDTLHGPITSERTVPAFLPMWFDALMFPNDWLFVEQNGCIQPEAQRGVPTQVQHAHALEPELDYVFLGDRTISVYCTAKTDDGQVVPANGASVDVFVKRSGVVLWVATGHAAAEGWATLGLQGVQIQYNDQILATCLLCPPERVGSGWENPWTPRPPSPPQLVAPAPGATIADQQPTFSWKDPEAGSPFEAVSYSFGLRDVGTNHVLISNQPVASTSFRDPQPELAYDHSYEWQVVSHGRRGDSGTSTARVIVKQPEQPGPSNGGPPKWSGFSKLQIWNCNTQHDSDPNTGGAVKMYVSNKTVGGGWQYVQDIPAAYDANNSCGPTFSDPVEYALDDHVLYDFVFLDADMNGCDDVKPDNANCWKATLPNVPGQKGGPVYRSTIA